MTQEAAMLEAVWRTRERETHPARSLSQPPSPAPLGRKFNGLVSGLTSNQLRPSKGRDTE